LLLQYLSTTPAAGKPMADSSNLLCCNYMNLRDYFKVFGLHNFIREMRE